MIDLSDALNCIKVMKSRNFSYVLEYRIGIALCDFWGMSISYQKGEIVLYRKEETREDTETERKFRGRITVEHPMTAEQIKEQESKGSLITTLKTVVNVPSKYVGEVKIQ